MGRKCESCMRGKAQVTVLIAGKARYICYRCAEATGNLEPDSPDVKKQSSGS